MRPLKCSISFLFKDISVEGRIGFVKGEPVRARGIDAPSQRENFNYPSTIFRSYAAGGVGKNTLSILRIYPPLEG
jgi:hypothetical protein